MQRTESFSTHTNAEEVFVQRNFTLLSSNSKHPLRFALIAHATVILGILSGSTILYNIQYMTMTPAYKCDIEDIDGTGEVVTVSGHRTCTKEEICSHKELKWHVDWSKEESLDNWT